MPLLDEHSTCPKSRKPVIYDRKWALIRNLRDYFLPDFFLAAQYAFSLADIFDLAAELILFVFALGSGRSGRLF